jgi:hypothetical protein
VLVCFLVELPKEHQLLMLRQTGNIPLHLLLNVSVMLHRTWHTHKLQFLNARRQCENISAASARLPAAILTVRITHHGAELAQFG